MDQLAKTQKLGETDGLHFRRKWGKERYKVRFGQVVMERQGPFN